MPVASMVGWGDGKLPLALRLFGWKSRWVDTSRGKLHYFDVPGKGDGPPFLLIHGLGSRAADYALLVRRLKPLTRRIILPDLPGHGWSPGETPDAEDIRTVLAEALGQLVPEPAYVLGNSLGGLIAVRMALHAPERVRALLLLSPAGAPMEEHQVSRLRGLFQMQTFAESRHFVDQLLAVRPRIWPLLALGTIARLRRGPIRHILGNIRSEHLLTREEVASLSMPLWLFWGTADRILDEEQLSWYRAAVPSHAVVVTPEGFGHSPFMDRPGHFVATLRSFLESLPTAVAEVATTG